MNLFKRALSGFLALAVTAGAVFTCDIKAAAEEDFYTVTKNADNGTFGITITVSDGPMIDLCSTRLDEHIVTAEYVCENKTYSFALDYIKRYPYPVICIDEQLHDHVRYSDLACSWDTAYDDYGNAFYSTMTFTALTDEHIKELKTCKSINLSCCQAKGQRFPLETVTLSASSTDDGKNTAEKKNISSLTFPSISDKVYTGRAFTPHFTLTDGDYTLEKNKDYTVTYKNNKKVGIASIIFKGKGDYEGSKTINFNIEPKRPVLKASKKSDTKVKLSWKSVTGADKFEIYYSVNGKKAKKYTTVSGSKTSVTLTKLDFKKNDYRFYICAYAKDGSKKIYSDLSNTVTVK